MEEKAKTTVGRSCARIIPRLGHPLAEVYRRKSTKEIEYPESVKTGTGNEHLGSYFEIHDFGGIGSGKLLAQY